MGGVRRLRKPKRFDGVDRLVDSVDRLVDNVDRRVDSVDPRKGVHLQCRPAKIIYTLACGFSVSSDS